MIHIARLLALGLALGSGVLSAAEIRGAAFVLDGDSLRIAETEIRLHGIDAPEFKQRCRRAKRDWRCGLSAKQALQQMIGQEAVTCRWRERDKFERAIATCFVAGTDLNARMVEAGLALAYRRYSDRYVAQEKRARESRLGLWSSRFTHPWDWRREPHHER